MHFFLDTLRVKIIHEYDQFFNPLFSNLNMNYRVFTVYPIFYRDSWVRKLETASRHYLDTERRKRDKALSCKCLKINLNIAYIHFIYEPWHVISNNAAF